MLGDLEDRENFNKCFVKAQNKNEIEGVKLREYLNRILTKKRLKKSVLNNQIYEQKRIAYELKLASAEIRRGRKSNPTEISTIEQDLHLQLRREPHRRKMAGTSLCRRTSISICGHNIAEDDIKPKLYFWSQDESTHLPALTAFCGYGRERSLTEVKLLGQDVYAGNRNRETQSAGPRMHTGQSSYMTSIPVCMKGRMFGPETHQTREKVPSVNLAGTKNFAKIYDLKADVKSSPDDKHADMRSASELPMGSVGNLPDITIGGRQTCTTDLWRGDPKAIKSVRRPRRKLTEMSPRKDDVRKCYRDMIQRNPCSKSCRDLTITPLERSYTMPMLATNTHRAKHGRQDGSEDGQPYSKSAFGASMQTVISRNVLRNPALPAAFRKASSTYLKHYSAPIMEEKAPIHFNTPDLPGILVI